MIFIIVEEIDVDSSESVLSLAGSSCHVNRIWPAFGSQEDAEAAILAHGGDIRYKVAHIEVMHFGTYAEQMILPGEGESGGFVVNGPAPSGGSAFKDKPFRSRFNRGRV